MNICSESEAIKNLTRILDTEKFSMIPVGNHVLGRHLVYRVESSQFQPFIYKQYCKKNRRVRELTALKKLEGSGIPCPKIESYGVTELGVEWLILSFLEGKNLDCLWDELDIRQKEVVFYQMGSILSKIHSVETYEHFGYWSEENSDFLLNTDYYTEFCRRNEVVFRQLESQKLPHLDLLENAIYKINENADMVKGIKESRLIHRDYDGRNILAGSSSGSIGITGILDFEQSCAGNAETDLADVYARYFVKSDEFEKSFLKGYRKHLPVDPDFFLRLPLYILSKGVTICSWSYRKAPTHYQEGIELITQLSQT